MVKNIWQDGYIFLMRSNFINSFIPTLEHPSIDWDFEHIKQHAAMLLYISDLRDTGLTLGHVKLRANVQDHGISWWVFGVCRTMCVFSALSPLCKLIFGSVVCKVNEGEDRRGGQSQITWFLTRLLVTDQAAKANKWAKHCLIRKLCQKLASAQVRQGKKHFKGRGFPLEV